MLLKRNLLSILFAALFVVLMGIGLFQIMNITITTAASKYIIAGIIVLGLIIYLIIAFLVKEVDYLRVIEKRKALFVILECFVVIGCLGLLFVIRSVNGMNIAILHCILLLCLYLVGRMLFGRLNGILTAFVGLSILLLMDNILPLDSRQTTSLLCLFVPYAIFLGLIRFFVKAFGKNGVLLLFSYLVMSAVFSLAIARNPLTILLFTGCLISLLFSSNEGEYSNLAKGFIIAGFLLLFTSALLFATYLIMPEILLPPSYQLDATISTLKPDLSILSFIINKLTKPVNYIQLAFRHGIIPTILIFFSVLPGYYCIRKKFSYSGPLLFSFVGLSMYYLLFCETGSDFYYLTYFIPIFSAYGITNTLLGEKQEDVKPETIKEETELPVKELEETTQKETYDEKTNIPTPNSTSSSLATAGKFSFMKKKSEDIPEWTISNEYIEPAVEEQSDAVIIPTPEDVTSNESIIPSSDEVSTEAIEASLKEEADDWLLAPPEEVSDESSITPSTEVSDESILAPSAKVSDESSIAPPEEVSDESILAPSEEVSDESILAPKSDEDIPDAVGDNDFLEFTDNNYSEENPVADEEEKLDELLERLDISEHIKRMNESAQEDMADVIEREEEQLELDEALPLKPSKSTLPKYKKPTFDFEIEPISIPLDESYSNISEYDEVPTVHELEARWKSEDSEAIETVATNITEEQSNHDMVLDKTKEEPLHTEEIVKKTGRGKRSYHRITIR